MRIFQNAAIMRAYLPRLSTLIAGVSSFADQHRIFLHDRFAASHILKPVLDGSPNAFFAIGNHEQSQRAWAREQGLKANIELADILLAQIEAHNTEVFYNLDPVRYHNNFVARLPGCVRHKFAWLASPSGAVDVGAYDLVLCNFPSILAGFTARGWRGAYFVPAHDPAMDAIAGNTDRPIDVLFIGGYTRHHKGRVKILEAVAGLHRQHRVEFALDRSRMTQLAETPLGLIGPLKQHRRPAAIRAVSVKPVFGRDLIEMMGRAKIVLNGAIDMAAADRGNMRCFEAMGCGATLLSDDGTYPAGMVSGETLATYRSVAEAVAAVQRLLAEPGEQRQLATAGYQMIRERYSKARQLAMFEALV
jgi:glycosyltransferase involved in cell wall biosynthesis